MAHSLQSSLGGARGLGSAKSGVTHWWMQRVTALALVPLSLWFVCSLIAHLGADYNSVVAWLTSPYEATLMVLFLAAGYYHAQLGLQIVIEDYVHTDLTRIAAVVALNFANVLMAVASIVSVGIILAGSLS